MTPMRDIRTAAVKIMLAHLATMEQRATEGGTCKYRGDENPCSKTRCLVGALIDNKVYATLAYAHGKVSDDNRARVRLEGKTITHNLVLDAVALSHPEWELDQRSASERNEFKYFLRLFQGKHDNNGSIQYVRDDVEKLVEDVYRLSLIHGLD